MLLPVVAVFGDCGSGFVLLSINMTVTERQRHTLAILKHTHTHTHKQMTGIHSQTLHRHNQTYRNTHTHRHTPVGPTRRDTGTRPDSWCFSGPPSPNLSTAAPLSHTWPTPDRLYKRFRSLRSHTHTEMMRLQVSAHTNTHLSVTDRRAAGYRRWTAEASRESWPDLWFCSCILRRREPNTRTTGSTGPSLLNTETTNITCTVTLQGQTSWMEVNDFLFYRPWVVWTRFWNKSVTPPNYSLEGVASPCKICVIHIHTNTNSSAFLLMH